MSTTVHECWCGATYTRAEFLALPLPASGRDHMGGEDVVLVLRQCRCGSSRAIPAQCAVGCAECAKVREEWAL